MKNFGSWLGGKVAEVVVRKPPHIYMSPFKIIRGEVVQELIRYRGTYPYVDGLLFQVTTAGHVLHTGARVRQAIVR